MFGGIGGKNARASPDAQQDKDSMFSAQVWRIRPGLALKSAAAPGSEVVDTPARALALTSVRYVSRSG